MRRLLGPTVLFHREGMFYPIQLERAEDVAGQVALHAASNPGTLQVTALDGTVLWQPPQPADVQ